MSANAAGNVNVHLLMSSFPPSPGAVFDEDAHTSRLRVERAASVAGAPSLHLPAVSSEESEGGVTRPRAGGGPLGGQRGWGGGLLANDVSNNVEAHVLDGERVPCRLSACLGLKGFDGHDTCMRMATTSHDRSERHHSQLRGSGVP